MDLPSKTIFSNGSHDIIARGRAEQKRTFQQFPKLLGEYDQNSNGSHVVDRQWQVRAAINVL